MVWLWESAQLAGLNLVGLERRGFDKADVKTLMKVFKQLFRVHDGTFKERLEQISNDYADNEAVSFMVEFCPSKHPARLCQPK